METTVFFQSLFGTTFFIHLLCISIIQCDNLFLILSKFLLCRAGPFFHFTSPYSGCSTTVPLHANSFFATFTIFLKSYSAERPFKMKSKLFSGFQGKSLDRKLGTIEHIFMFSLSIHPILALGPYLNSRQCLPSIPLLNPVHKDS